MPVNIDAENLKKGLLGLAVALIEIIRDALELQALRRMESGNLSERECDRLGNALLDLNEAIEGIKSEHGLEAAVQSVRQGLDDLVDEMISTLAFPWEERQEGHL